MNNIGFIFDLDGVLVDTAKYHYKAWKKLASDFGMDFTEEQNEAFKGVSRKRCLEILLELAGKTISEKEFNVLLYEKNEDYLSYIENMDASEILPGVIPALDFLKENEVPIALGSASKNAIPIVEKVGLLPYFSTVVDGNRTARAKPDPEVFLIAAKDLGVTPRNCVVFEDAQAGIEAANSAGMLTVGIGDPSVLNEAHYNFVGFLQISREFFKQLKQELKQR